MRFIYDYMKLKRGINSIQSKHCLFMLLSSIIGFLIFWIYPFIKNFYYMFADGNFFKNIEYLFNNRYFLLAIKNTFLFTGFSTPIAVIISLIFAMLTLKVSKKNAFIRNAFFLPVIMPSAVLVAVWQILFPTITPFKSLLLIYLWKYSGLYYIIVLTALASLDQNIIDAAMIDGASYMKRVIHIMIPSIIPTLFFIFILSISDSLKIFRESYLLYGTYPDEEVYMLQNFLNNHFNKLNYNYISTASILLVVMYVFVAILGMLERRWSEKIW